MVVHCGKGRHDGLEDDNSRDGLYNNSIYCSSFVTITSSN
jgi:hypothetical protein